MNELPSHGIASPPATPSTHSDGRPLFFLPAWVIYSAVAAVGIVYLFQLPTPLRMNTDAISYLLLAASFHDGHGFIVHHHRSHFPPGYPVIVATLERAGYGTSLGMVAWNELMLAISVGAGVWLIRRWLGLPRPLAWAAVLLLLLSRCTVRYSVIPGSEPTYMALSTLALACFYAAERNHVLRGRRPPPRVVGIWAVGLVFLTAILLRSIGVFLLPAAGWSAVLLWWHSRAEQLPLRPWLARHRRALAIAGAAMLIALGIVLAAVTRTAYFREGFALMASHGIVSGLSFTLRQRCIEAGSILTNFWFRTNPRGQRTLLLAGMVGLPLILLTIARRLARPASPDVYLVGYVALLLVWPYKADNRFWLPIQLFIYALLVRELASAANHGARWPRAAALAWGGLFLATGTVVLAWTTRLTYAGPMFSERYDLDFMQNTYRQALHNGLPVDPAKVNPDLLAVMQRYGKPQLH